MTFRDRLLARLRAIQPILDVRGVLVAGSEVPNLLEVDARPGMPDPRPRRLVVDALSRRLEPR